MLRILGQESGHSRDQGVGKAISKQPTNRSAERGRRTGDPEKGAGREVLKLEELLAGDKHYHTHMHMITKPG